jgi:hypothetical protein
VEQKGENKGKEIMNFFKSNYKKIIGVVVICLILVIAYWYGGNSPGSRGFGTSTEKNSNAVSENEADNDENNLNSDTNADINTFVENDGEDTSRNKVQEASTNDSLEDKTENVQDDTTESTSETIAENNVEDTADNDNNDLTEAAVSEASTTEKASDNNTEQHEEKNTNKNSGDATEKNNDKTKTPSEKKSGKNDADDKPQNTVAESTTEKSQDKTTSVTDKTTEEGTSEEKTYTCTISIYCSTILNNMDLLDPAKVSCVPSDGCILGSTTVEFENGDTVFDILQKVTRDKGIQMEYTYTAIYGSVYIEGINNLYEFDCGELSGWEYSVNGSFPGYGCSKYVLSDGDVIRWVYTCDLGADIGNYYGN